MKRFLVQLIGWGGIVSVATAVQLRDSTFESISNYYSRVVQRLSPKGGFLQAAYSAPLTPKSVLEDECLYLGPVLDVQTPFGFTVNKRTAEIIGMSNYRLDRHLETNAVQKAPKLTVPEVLKRAKGYLTDLETSVPEHCRLQSVTFNDGYRSQWEVVWVPTVAGYTYDDFIEPHVQSLGIRFHEEYGFCGHNRSLEFPVPKSTEVKITKEDAIVRASRVAPLVMKTPFYRMARASGFKITGVKNAELKIAAPNWLLDPARAVWIREEPPEETRLCWIVTLVAVDTIERQGMKLKPVNILIYVDAATGEVVGANFS